MITEMKPIQSVEVFIGPPASGKSSHSVKYAIENGANLIRGRDIAGELAKKHEGNRTIVPDEFFIPVLKQVLEQRNGEHKDIIFDNIPRTRAQAEFLSDWANNINASLRTIVLELDKEEVLRRFLDRTACIKCETSYHPDVNPEKILGQCNKDGQRLIRRIGDKIENVEHAYSTYQNMIAEIIPILEKKGNLYYVSAIGTITDTYIRLQTAIFGKNVSQGEESKAS